MSQKEAQDYLNFVEKIYQKAKKKLGPVVN